MYDLAFNIVVLVITSPEIENWKEPGTEAEQSSMKVAIVDSYTNVVNEDNVTDVGCFCTTNVFVIFDVN